LAESSIRHRIVAPEIPEPPPGLWSNCIKVGQQVFISGLVAYENGKVVSESAGDQAQYIFSAMKKYMEAAGGSLANIATMTVFVTNLDDRPAILEARRRVFSGDFPCSTLIKVSALIDPGLHVEINAVGILESGSGTQARTL